MKVEEAKIGLCSLKKIRTAPFFGLS